MLRVFSLAVLAFACLVSRGGTAGEATPPPARTIITHDPAVEPIIGVYVSGADPKGAISIIGEGGGGAELRSGRQWEARGWYSRGEFVGIWRHPAGSEDSTATPIYGLLRFRRDADGSLTARFTDEAGAAPREEQWKFVNRYGAGGGPLPEHIPAASDRPDSTPQLGDYVYVDELPEATDKVPPLYPDAARRRGIEGTVIVQSLIGSDGRVHDTKVVKSIRGLDEAAIAAVTRWRFKPAMSKGKPVAVWVAIPVKFSLH